MFKKILLSAALSFIPFKIGVARAQTIAQNGPQIEMQRTCGTESPSPYKMRQLQREWRQYELFNIDSQPGSLPINIEVRVFVLLRPDSKDVEASTIQAQVDLLSSQYSAFKIKFNLSSVKQLRSKQISQISGISDSREMLVRDFGQKLRTPQNGVLDIFVIDVNTGDLGASAFPWNAQDFPFFDMVFIQKRTLPGGHRPYNMGKTLVHEVGHWLGLFHVFEGGCYGEGDFVGDTPAQAAPIYNCVATVACDGRMPAPIHNLMNYTDDKCLSEFTPGQALRVHQMLAQYRGLRGVEPGAR